MERQRDGQQYDVNSREFKLEVLAVEEMLDCVVYTSKQLSCQICLESGDGSRIFVVPRD